MADTAHALRRFRALSYLHLVQPWPEFEYAATVATLPATLVELTLEVFTPIKVRSGPVPSSANACCEVLLSTASAMSGSQCM